MRHSNSSTTVNSTPISTAPASSAAERERSFPQLLKELAKEDAKAALPFITDAQVERAEEAVSNIVKIRSLALRVTGEHDWIDVAGKPYLNSSGCMKVAALFGVSLINTRVEQLNEKFGAEPVIRYVAQTTAKFLDRALEVEGISSSNESFFARKNGKTLPLSEVDLNAVRKKAVTNAHNRAVTRILGLGGITWDEVHDAGVKRGKMATVSYGKPEAPRPSPRSGGDASAKTVLSNMLADIAAAEDIPPWHLLKKYSVFEGRDGKARWADSVDDMSDRWAEKTKEKVEPVWRRLSSELSPAIAGERGDA